MPHARAHASRSFEPAAAGITHPHPQRSQCGRAPSPPAAPPRRALPPSSNSDLPDRQPLRHWHAHGVELQRRERKHMYPQRAWETRARDTHAACWLDAQRATQSCAASLCCFAGLAPRSRRMPGLLAVRHGVWRAVPPPSPPPQSVRGAGRAASRSVAAASSPKPNASPAQSSVSPAALAAAPSCA